MIFFFTGEERYLIDKKIDKWKKAFIKKYGSENVYIFGEGNFSPDKIEQALLGGGLFDNKKFIVIKGVPKDTYTKIPSLELEKVSLFIEKHINEFNKENIIVFVSYKPDKRTKFYKFLSKNENVKLEEYKLFTEKQLIAYLKKTFNISNDLAYYIINKTGTNLFNIHNELEKILKINDKITKELVDKYVAVTIQQNSFALIDNITDKKKSIQILENLKENDEDFFRILGLLYWNIKNIVFILEQKELGYNFNEIAINVGAHPFVVSKILKSYKDSNLFKKMFKKLIDLDYSIKTGTIDGKLGFLYLKKILLDIN